jgi:hypothetical protein
VKKVLKALVYITIIVIMFGVVAFRLLRSCGQFTF